MYVTLRRGGGGKRGFEKKRREQDYVISINDGCLNSKKWDGICF